MFTTKLRIGALLFLTIILLVSGGILIPWGAHGEAAPTPAAPKVPKDLLEKRQVVAKKVWDMKLQSIKFVGLAATRPSDLLGWSERLLEAELALVDKQEERIKALQAHLDRAREIERIVGFYVLREAARESDVFAATYERINADIRYFEATGKMAPLPGEGKDGPPVPEGLKRPLPPSKKKN